MVLVWKSIEKFLFWWHIYIGLFQKKICIFFWKLPFDIGSVEGWECEKGSELSDWCFNYRHKHTIFNTFRGVINRCKLWKMFSRDSDQQIIVLGANIVSAWTVDSALMTPWKMLRMVMYRHIKCRLIQEVSDICYFEFFPIFFCDVCIFFHFKFFYLIGRFILLLFSFTYFIFVYFDSCKKKNVFFFFIILLDLGYRAV